MRLTSFDKGIQAFIFEKPGLMSMILCTSSRLLIPALLIILATTTGSLAMKLEQTHFDLLGDWEISKIGVRNHSPVCVARKVEGLGDLVLLYQEDTGYDAMIDMSRNPAHAQAVKDEAHMSNILIDGQIVAGNGSFRSPEIMVTQFGPDRQAIRPFAAGAEVLIVFGDERQTFSLTGSSRALGEIRDLCKSGIDAPVGDAGWGTYAMYRFVNGSKQYRTFAMGFGKNRLEAWQFRAFLDANVGQRPEFDFDYARYLRVENDFVEQDLERALEIYESIDSDFARHNAALLIIREKVGGRSAVDALELLKPIAEKGTSAFATAQTVRMLLRGEDGVERDLEAAETYLEALHSADDPAADYLGGNDTTYAQHANLILRGQPGMDQFDQALTFARRIKDDDGKQVRNTLRKIAYWPGSQPAIDAVFADGTFVDTSLREWRIGLLWNGAPGYAPDPQEAIRQARTLFEGGDSLNAALFLLMVAQDGTPEQKKAAGDITDLVTGIRNTFGPSFDADKDRDQAINDIIDLAVVNELSASLSDPDVLASLVSAGLDVYPEYLMSAATSVKGLKLRYLARLRQTGQNSNWSPESYVAHRWDYFKTNNLASAPSILFHPDREREFQALQVVINCGRASEDLAARSNPALDPDSFRTLTLARQKSRAYFAPFAPHLGVAFDAATDLGMPPGEPPTDDYLSYCTGIL